VTGCIPAWLTSPQVNHYTLLLYTVLGVCLPKTTTVHVARCTRVLLLFVTQENRVNYNQRNYQAAFSEERSKDALYQSKEQLSIFDLVTVNYLFPYILPRTVCDLSGK